MGRSARGSLRADHSPHEGASLFGMRDGFLYIAPQAFAGPTRRAPITLLVSLSGAPFRLVAGDVELVSSIALVPPGMERSFSLSNDGVGSLNIEPTHRQFATLKRGLGGTARALPARPFARIETALRLLLDGTLPEDEVTPLFDRAVALTGGLLGSDACLGDQRIVDLVERVSDIDCVDFDYGWALRRLALSPSRASHLFTDQVGLSMRSFIAWRRTKEAMCRLANTASVTRVAHEAGFSDSAHLSRTMKSSIGISPSRIGCSREIQFRDLRDAKNACTRVSRGDSTWRD